MFRVVSSNLRYDEPADGPNAWPRRRSMVARLLRELQADVVGLQEVLPGQARDLAADLPDYHQSGRGRNPDGGGEHCLILSRARPRGQETFWLSPTPERCSLGWDACLPRISTWITLELEGQVLTIANLHLDHLGQQARRESLALVSARLRGSAVLLGDFNQDAPTLEGLQLLVPASSPGTFHDFRGGNGPSLDHLYCTPDLHGTCRVETASEGGRYPSDHYPLVADLSWR